MDIRQAIKLATLGSAGIAIVACSNGGDELTSALEGAQYVSVEVSVDSENQVFGVGTFEFLTATATLADGSTEDVTNRVQWSVSDSSLATVASPANGEAFARLTANSGSATGNVTATASFNLAGLEDSVELQVSDAELNDGGLELFIDDEDVRVSQISECTGPFTLVAEAAYSDGQRIVTHLINDEDPGWSLVGDNTTALSLDAGAGQLSANGIDSSGNLSVDLQAEFGDEVATATIDVLDNLDSDSITIAGGAASLEIGRTTSFSASGLFDGETKALTNDLTWSLGNSSSSVLSLDDASSGTYTALESGQEDIAVRCGGTSSDAYQVTVTDEITGVEVQYNNSGIDGESFPLSSTNTSSNTAQFRVVYVFKTDGPGDEAITDGVEWRVERTDGETGGATIDDEGEVTYTSAGRYRVIAEVDDQDSTDTYQFSVD